MRSSGRHREVALQWRNPSPQDKRISSAGRAHGEREFIRSRRALRPPGRGEEVRDAVQLFVMDSKEPLNNSKKPFLTANAQRAQRFFPIKAHVFVGVLCAFAVNNNLFKVH